MGRLEELRALIERVPPDVTTASLISVGLLAFGFIWGRIFARAGHHPAMGFLMLIPLVNVAMFLSLAFGRWPIEKELRKVRRTLHDSAESLRRAA